MSVNTNKRKLSLSKRSKSKYEEYTTRDLPSLRRKRTIAFNRLSKALQIGNDAKLDATKLDLFLSYCNELQKISTDFENAHLLILDLHDDSESDDEGVRESFDDMYFNVLALQRTYTKPKVRNEPEQNSSSHIKLPKVTLPTYSGNIKCWTEYINTFNSLINENTSLSNLEKFHYLRSSLSGDALALIRAYPVAGEYYIDAYNALVNRYRDKRDLAFTSDPGFDIPGPVDLLLGADVFADSLLTERIKGGPSQPPAFNSVFGWLLLGKTLLSCSSLAALQSNVESERLVKLVEQFWELDSVSQANSYTPEDILCEKEYVATTTRDKSGRYEVYLPFKNSCEPVFMGSREIAERRFYALERRLSRNPDLKCQYVNFMQDYIQSGHMSLVPVSENRRGKYYIPHHCIIRPDSPTTQLRVVFDASAKDNRGNSLNESLWVGPKCQTDITRVLLHFREHAIVFMADIRQMYRQVLVAPAHREYQRILWRSNSDQHVSEYRLNTVTYGVSSAPYLACRTIQQLARDEGDSFPLAKETVTCDIYVDDIVTGTNTMFQARELKSQVIALLKSGNFELRKWASNKPELLEEIPPEHCLVEAKSFIDAQSCTLKVLGLKWDPLRDSFVFHVQPLNKVCTKRSILSEVSRIFDPLGFLSPVTIHIKILIQQLWVAGVAWDETPPDNIVRMWTNYVQQLPSIQNLIVPRRCTVDHAISYELHGFCDSSEKAYGAVIYLRVTDNSDRIHTYFVCSKARVAPLKKLSLPRLELCAAMLLVDLLKFVKETYMPRINFSITLWSDSTVVLSWLRAHSSKWTTFVANRVSHIQSIAPIDQWRHVSTHDNPADICSRGQFPQQLVDNTLWWAGPTWLRKPHTEWPSSSSSITDIDDNIISSEIRRNTTLLIQQTAPINPNLDPFLEELLNSDLSLDAIIDKIAYAVIRKSDTTDSVLSSDERHQSLLMLVKYIQSLSFSIEIEKIRSRQSLSKSYRKLNLFIDNQEVLRVGGRISRSGLEYEQVLTPGHFLTLEPLTSVPDTDSTHVNINRLDRWQLIQTFQRSFWNRWRNEYLHTLTLRAKWTKDSKPLELNSMVIIKDDNHPPLHWQIGRVVELHPGPDGQVRVATIKTDKNNLIKRPLVKLCPLPNEPF
ncbi:uncharacterized protein LOC113520032 [Galleria mellonella]|uniref:Uncharacterized protein LOC113520032 n=1 Tax=Galleria mellonella TaxID=7137 RepID=A0ABM3MEW5_GALME|nr:uncharacterized protein LOC113520032 [Galleria mellonella]